MYITEILINTEVFDDTNLRFLDLFMCMNVLPSYISVYCIMPGACGDQKRVSDPMEL